MSQSCPAKPTYGDVSSAQLAKVGEPVQELTVSFENGT
jgi:hypothetical protein